MSWWNRKDQEVKEVADQVVDDHVKRRADPHRIAPKPKEKSDDRCNYTVGITLSGETVLKIGSGYDTMTMTMNDVATRQMIRLLEATLPEGNDDVETD